jgi:hypothetical protein
MELFAADSLSPLISPLRDAAMRADRLIVAVLRRVLEVVLRETGLTPLPDELRISTSSSFTASLHQLKDKPVFA